MLTKGRSRRRRTMQTAVHFLRVDQFRAFSGSFSQSSSRLSTGFSISSSELGEVGSPCSREKVRSNDGVESDPTVAFSATWEELEGCLADIGILWVVVPSPFPDTIFAEKVRMEERMGQKRGRRREGKKRLQWHPICGKYKYRKNVRKYGLQ